MMNYSPFSYLMYVMMLMSTIMVLLSSNWIMAWIMLEINMISFLPLMNMKKSNQETSAATKYFLAQAMGSLLLLLSSSMMYQKSMNYYMYMLLIMALLIKLGASPCHYWYPAVMSMISWNMCLLLSTWQKLAPLSLLIMMSYKDNNMMMILAGLNTLIGGIMGMNQTHLRMLLAYSSIGHIGWMMSMIAINKSILALMYFVLYCMVVSPVFMMMMVNNTKTINNMYSMFKSSSAMLMMLMLMLLSLGGLPPLTGFAPKLMVITNMLNYNHIMLLILLMSSYMNLYYYLNIAMSSMLASNLKSMINKKNKSLNLVMVSTSFIGIPLIMI